MKKHTMKKSLTVLLTLALTFALAACGGDTNDDSAAVEIPPASALHQMLGEADAQVQATYGAGNEDADSEGNIWSRTYPATEVNEGIGDLRFIFDEAMQVQSISLVFTEIDDRAILEGNLDLAFGERETMEDETNEGETFFRWMHDNGQCNSEIILSDANGPLQLIMNTLQDVPTEDTPAIDDALIDVPTTDVPTEAPEIEEPTVDQPAEVPEDDTAEAMPTSALSPMMAQILTNVGELPALGETVLDQETFSYYAFIDYQEGFEGLVSEAMIGSIAHSVVLVQVPQDADVQAVAAQIEQNANPAKWICVEAEKTIVDTKDNIIVLIMSNQATADAIHQNFLAL